MAFPDITRFRESHPGPYERQMGSMIAALLALFADRMPDSESNQRVAELAGNPSRWSAGHAVFDEVRHRLLAALDGNERLRRCQYSFEESCCQALYNATGPQDEFDPGSPFFVVPQALGLAELVGIPIAEVVAALVPDTW